NHREGAQGGQRLLEVGKEDNSGGTEAGSIATSVRQVPDEYDGLSLARRHRGQPAALRRERRLGRDGFRSCQSVRGVGGRYSLSDAPAPRQQEPDEHSAQHAAALSGSSLWVRR